MKASKITKAASTKGKTAALKSAEKSSGVFGKLEKEEKERPVDFSGTNIHLLSEDGKAVVHPPSETQHQTSTTTAENVLEKAIAHILSIAPQLETLIKAHPCAPYQPTSLASDILDPFASLCSGIISQQVSGAAAATIKARFIQLFNLTGSKFPTPTQVLEKDIPTLRTAGLSQRKAEYITSLAEAFIAGDLSQEILMKGSDDEVKERLVKVRGIGEWSAEMFLLFHLRRVDVFSVGDLGIQRGMAVLMGRDVARLKNAKGKWKYMSEKEMREIAERFRPYRSIFMWYMWKLSDTQVESMTVASKAKKATTVKKGRKKKDEEESASEEGIE
ncbi:DNA glycosylase [Ascodesmis nigricans]|uniref:DNA glycosylase n=1 Tax=Ascodesmis nigricans TaxID=341454 RepID=A0A4S2MUW5_9PEZI|nr:DNA glycosylase [Ascodesmis nigricans]